MAVLGDPDRVLCWRDAMDRSYDIGAIVKADLRTAINDIDAWVDANATAFNTSISQPARGALTSKQKAALLMLVVARRFSVA